MKQDSGLEPVEVKSETRADELFCLLSLPATFHPEVRCARFALHMLMRAHR